MATILLFCRLCSLDSSLAVYSGVGWQMRWAERLLVADKLLIL